jgi:hypothetical protein
MATLQWFLTGAMTVALVACDSNSGAGGAGTPDSNTGDSQIAPEDAQDALQDSGLPDAGPDATPDTAATDAIAGTDIASDTGDVFQAQNCIGSGGSSTCTNGLTCWTPPCPKCGMMPQGWCVPPLTNGGCYDYTQCNGGDCHNANAMEGVAGWCLPANKIAGQCWPNSSGLIPDCYTDSTCFGASVCPPGAECLVADKPGQCTASDSQKGSVYLWERNGGIVSPGETVIVTWINYTSASIFLPGCSTYNLQTSPDSKTWTDKGPTIECVWEGNAVEVPSGGYADTQNWIAPSGPGTVTNYRFHGSYSTGCTPGKPISQGGCTGSNTADSQSFFVGYVP